VFHVKVTIAVNHSDRDIEFIMFKTVVRNFIHHHLEDKDLGDMSCEMMAEKIHDYLLSRDYKDPMTIEVSEDGENGGIVAWS
jgi:hypothetical protein